MWGSRVLYVCASVILTVHGIFHVWQDLMLLPPERNPLEFLFGSGQFGLAVHIFEWPILFTALSVAFLEAGELARRKADSVDGPRDLSAVQSPLGQTSEGREWKPDLYAISDTLSEGD